MVHSFFDYYGVVGAISVSAMALQELALQELIYNYCSRHLYKGKACAIMVVLLQGPLYQPDVKMTFVVLIVPFQNMTGLQGEFCHKAYAALGGIDHSTV